jgi:hypothetical protein
VRAPEPRTEAPSAGKEQPARPALRSEPSKTTTKKKSKAAKAKKQKPK